MDVHTTIVPGRAQKQMIAVQKIGQPAASPARPTPAGTLAKSVVRGTRRLRVFATVRTVVGLTRATNPATATLRQTSAAIAVMTIHGNGKRTSASNFRTHVPDPCW